MSINEQIAALWDGLGAEWTHIAIDNDGTICAYTAAPVKTGGTWQPSEGTYRNLQNVVFDEVYTRPAPTDEFYTSGVTEYPELFTDKDESPAYTAEQLRKQFNKTVFLEKNGRLMSDEETDLYADIIEFIQKQQP